MYEIVKLLFDIGLFKKGPQDLPYSPRLQKILIGAYAAVRFLMIGGTIAWTHTLFQIASEIVFIAAFSWLLLFPERKLNRFCQVTSAFFGVFAIIGFFVLPAFASMATEQTPWLAYSVTAVLTGWFCAAATHIVHHTLDQRLRLSIPAAILFLLGSYLLFDSLSL